MANSVENRETSPRRSSEHSKRKAQDALDDGGGKVRALSSEKALQAENQVLQKENAHLQAIVDGQLHQRCADILQALVNRAFSHGMMVMSGGGNANATCECHYDEAKVQCMKRPRYQEGQLGTSGNRERLQGAGADFASAAEIQPARRVLQASSGPPVVLPSKIDDGASNQCKPFQRHTQTMSQSMLNTPLELKSPVTISPFDRVAGFHSLSPIVSVTPHDERRCSENLTMPPKKSHYRSADIDATHMEFYANDSFSPLRSIKLFQGESQNVSRPRSRKCSCKRSKCLKLYCECFAAGRKCDGCGCSDCQNTIGNEKAIKKAENAIKARNPAAFTQKIESAYNEENSSRLLARGCKCRKTFCRKKYCECFQAGVPCSERCNCLECKNWCDATIRAPLHQRPAERIVRSNPPVSLSTVLDKENINPIGEGSGVSEKQDMVTTNFLRESNSNAGTCLSAMGMMTALKDKSN